MQALQTRTHMGGINAARLAVRNHALNASQMQSRLDRALLHYHTLLTRNKALQADIQELRYAASLQSTAISATRMVAQCLIKCLCTLLQAFLQHEFIKLVSS